MPYIVKRLESENIEFGNKKTLILDIERTAEITKELDLLGISGKGITYKEALELKQQFGDAEAFKSILEKDGDERKWLSIARQIDNIEEFYNIIWERTVLELMFMSQYYISLISNPQSFEQVLKGGSEFEYWFMNNIKYNMLEKIKEFYLKTVKIYANKVSLDIYETDVEIKIKEIISEIEGTHLLQIKDLLEIKWNETMEKYKVWVVKENEKRKTILFED